MEPAATTVSTIKLELAKEIGRKDILMSVARIAQSDRLLVGSSDFRLYDFDLASDKPILLAHDAAHESYVTGVAIAGSQIVTCGFDRRLIWWNAETRKPERTIADAHQRFIRDCQASPDGKFVVSVGDDMVAKVWHGQSGELLRELRGHDPMTPHHYPSMLYACAISADSQYIATADKTGKIIVWQASDGAQLAKLDCVEMYTWDPKQRRHSIGGVRSLAFSPDGNYLAVGGMGQVGNIDHLEGKARVEIFQWRSSTKTHTYADNEFKGLVQSLAFHPSGNWLMAAGGDNSGFLMFFDLKEPKKSIRDEKAPMHIHRATLNESGDSIYAVGHNRVVKWKVSSAPA